MNRCSLLIILTCLSLTSFGQLHLDSLEASYLQAKEDSSKVLTAIRLSIAIHRNSPDEVRELSIANAAVDLSGMLKDTVLYARALDNVGLLYRYHQKYNEAIVRHMEAFSLIEDRAVNSVYKMIFANNAGVAARYNQEYDLSINYYMKALKIAEREQNLQNIAISCNGIGNALSHLPHRQEEALEYFKQSLDAEEKRSNPLGIAMNYLSIADYYINKNSFSTAREYLDKLFDLNARRNDLYGLAITYQFYGLSYLKEGKNYGKASSYFRNSLERFRNLHNAGKEAELLYNLGEVSLNNGEKKEALRYFRESLKMAKEISDNGLAMNNSYRLSDVYEQLKMPGNALEYLKEAQKFENKINLADQNVKIAATIRQYDLESKINHIQLLEKDKAIREIELENQQQTLRQRQITILLLTTALLSILIIAVLQYRNRSSRKKNLALIQKEEKEKMKAIYEKNLAQAEILTTRLQINPHFLFNCLNAIKYLIQSEQNQKAMKYLVVFSRYTRIVLETSSKSVIPLSEELALTRYYLTLEENRFENDFSFEINDYDQKYLEGISIPPMLLQPFIENAIWHGLLPSKREKKILSLNLIPLTNGIRIVIDDNGVGRKKTGSVVKDSMNKSMGMQITRDRIDLYNKSDICRITCQVIDKTDKKGNAAGTRVVLVITDSTVARKNIGGVSESVTM